MGFGFGFARVQKKEVKKEAKGGITKRGLSWKVERERTGKEVKGKQGQMLEKKGSDFVGLITHIFSLFF